MSGSRAFSSLLLPAPSAMMRLLFSRRAEKQLYDRKSQPSRIRTPEGIASRKICFCPLHATHFLRIMFAFSSKPPLHDFPSPKRPEAQRMSFKRQIPGEAISTCIIFFGRSSISPILTREFDVREAYSASLLSSQWIPSRSCLSQLISVLVGGSLIFVSRRSPGRPESRNRRSVD